MINVVCAVIEDADGRVLVCRRPEGKMLAGMWEFPGGKVESGEEPMDALRREVLEELNCRVEVREVLPAVVHDYPEFTIHLIPYRCEALQGIPEPLEHDEIRWVRPEECGQLEWAEADVPIWQRL